jgi:acetolactate synthase-1/2/3 large subunit
MPITKHSFLVTDPADIAARSPRPSTSPRPGARPGARRHLQGRLAGARPFLAGRARPARLPAVTKPHGKQVREAAMLVERPAVLYVGGGVIAPAPAPSCAPRRAHRRPSSPPDGRGALPDSHPQTWDARHARRSRAVTPCRRPTCIVASAPASTNGSTGQLRPFAPGQDRARRHRPGEISRTAMPTCDRRRLQGDHRRRWSALREQRRRTGDSSRVVGRPVRWPRATRSATTRRRRLACAAVRHRAHRAAAGPEATTSPASGQHQMWASQFVRYETAARLDQLRRPGHHGLRVPAAMGAKVGSPTGPSGRSTATAASR